MWVEKWGVEYFTLHLLNVGGSLTWTSSSFREISRFCCAVFCWAGYCAAPRPVSTYNKGRKCAHLLLAMLPTTDIV
jgi:hypothetical protein